MSATLDHFEIPVADAVRLARFLEAVFGWVLENDGDLGASGSEGSRYCRMAPAREDSGALETIRVGLFEGPAEILDRAVPVIRLTGESLETCLGRVSSAGGRTVLSPRQVGDSGRFARFEDPEGNPWGLWEPSRDRQSAQG